AVPGRRHACQPAVAGGGEQSPARCPGTGGALGLTSRCVIRYRVCLCCSGVTMQLDLIHISIERQLLTGSRAGRQLCQYPVSTAKNGAGELNGSGCTPRGRHRVRARIGEGQPPGAVFIGRRPTGEVWSPELAATHPQRDWILTRILWLCG